MEQNPKTDALTEARRRAELGLDKVVTDLPVVPVPTEDTTVAIHFGGRTGKDVPDTGSTEPLDSVTSFFGDPISIYSRAQAIEDGVLADVSEPAREAGFKFPVAVTSAVWHDVVTPPEGTQGYQDEAGRLWDLLTILRMAIRTSRDSTDRIQFAPLFVTAAGKPPVPVALRAECHGGDDGEPVITIFKRDEID